MNVVEQSVIGRSPVHGRCEDVLLVTDNVVAVIDGATNTPGVSISSEYGELSSGRFAALVVAEALKRIPPGHDPIRTVEQISDALATANELHVANVDDTCRPSASIVVFDALLQAVWRVGNCPFRIGHVLHRGSKRIDDVMAAFRAAYLAALPIPPTHGQVDVGREAILPLLRVQSAFANKPGEFGFGAIDGRVVPPEYIETVDVPSSTMEIVLASPGYPTLPATLALAEAELAQLLTEDPHRTGPLRGLWGLTPRQSAYDDRTWVRIVR